MTEIGMDREGGQVERNKRETIPLKGIAKFQRGEGEKEED